MTVHEWIKNDILASLFNTKDCLGVPPASNAGPLSFYSLPPAFFEFSMISMSSLASTAWEQMSTTP